MIVVELIIVLLAIFLGARLGGIGIGFAGGLGVLVLAAIGVKPGNIPFDVISIIMAVIAAISAMQVAGGLDYLVNQTEKLLRRNPKYITILAPIVTYFLTIFAGTGNISLATLPVIAEVAKEQGIKPCRPLSTAVVSAQIAITASPISAAVVYMSSVMEGHGISYIHLLSVVIQHHANTSQCRTGNDYIPGVQGSVLYQYRSDRATALIQLRLNHSTFGQAIRVRLQFLHVRHQLNHFQ